MVEAKKDRLIMAGAFVGAVVAITALVLWPQQKTLSSLNAKMVIGQDRLDANTQHVAIVPALIEQVESMRTQYANFDRRLPEEAGLGEFLQNVNNHLAEEGLVSEWIRPGDQQEGELFNTMPVEMRFQGSYVATVRFLERLASMERLVRVHELEISSEGEEPGRLNVEMQINIYYTKANHG
jgi:Tfp pilus assembly protein PilO